MAYRMVKPVYYGTMLQVREYEGSENTKMLQFILNSRVHDVGMISHDFMLCEKFADAVLSSNAYNTFQSVVKPMQKRVTTMNLQLEKLVNQ